MIFCTLTRRCSVRPRCISPRRLLAHPSSKHTLPALSSHATQSTSATTTPTTTPAPLCVDKFCGFLGFLEADSCQCDFGCKERADCCVDYDEYCVTTHTSTGTSSQTTTATSSLTSTGTTTTTPTTSQAPLCVDKLCGFLGFAESDSCQCDFGCTERGNCCVDYDLYCATTFTTTATSSPTTTTTPTTSTPTTTTTPTSTTTATSTITSSVTSTATITATTTQSTSPTTTVASTTPTSSSTATTTITSSVTTTQSSSATTTITSSPSTTMSTSVTTSKSSTATSTPTFTEESTNCKGKGTNGYRTNTDARCSCGHNCFDCNFSWEKGGAGQCNICKNKNALFEGNCISSQTCITERGTVFGSGNFGRRCLIPPTTQVATRVTTVPPPSQCASTPGWMSTSGNTCATYELGLNTHGLEFERLCTPEGATTAAFDKLMAAIRNGCKSPSGGPGGCTFSNDADVDGLTAKDACCTCGGGGGGGSGGAKTETTPVAPPATTAVSRESIPCAGKKTDVGAKCQCGANCHTCTVGPDLDILVGKCSICKNARSLFEGNCITGDYCKGSVIKGAVQGNGQFNRKCVAFVTTTDKDLNGGGGDQPVCRGKFTDALISEPQPCTCPSNCHTCKGAMCLKCKNKHALSGGQCITTSACGGAGGVVKGTGNFNRECNIASTTHTTIVTTATTSTRTTKVPCPPGSLDRFDNVRVGVRLQGAAALASNLKDGGVSKFPSVASSEVCADHCIAYGAACKAFELKARGGQLRCNLLSSSSTFGTSIVASAKFDLYERLNFCN